MAKRRARDRQEGVNKKLSNIENIAKETLDSNIDIQKKLDQIKNDNTKIDKNIVKVVANTTESPSKKIMGIISFILAVTGVSAFVILQVFFPELFSKDSPEVTGSSKEVETSAESAEDFEDVKTNNMIMYLSSEYKVLNPMFTTEITVTTEFEAKEVEVYSEKESEKYDTYLMSQESRYVWKFKAVFDEVGEYIITAKAVSESGQEIEESMIIIVRWH